MKIVIAPDSFKGSTSATEVANSIEKGILKVYEEAEVVKVPIADGGEGTVDAIVMGAKGKYAYTIVKDPLGREINAKYGLIDEETAVIEMAEASGITLLKESELNPLYTTTFGTGQLILDALNQGVKKIVLGIGGSATNDGGVGMAQALGVSFKNCKGEEISFGGINLQEIESIDMSGLDPRVLNTEFIVACDVTNPLCGPMGASYVYGPQKGATSEIVEVLDQGLNHLAKKIKEITKQDIINVPGTGAAGGLGAALLVFCKAKLKSGIETVLEAVKIERYLENVDLIITGEGKIDGQSVFGKVPVGISKIAKKKNIPVIAIVGSIGENAERVYEYGIDALISIIQKPTTLAEAMQNSEELIEKATINLMRIIKMKVDK